MEAGIATLGSSNGSLAAVGTAVKAFVLTHPMTIAATGGAILGIGAYYTLGKLFKKKGTTAHVLPAAA
jgi:membrane protein DedA with SNARE-associated domain